jgi:hypothetical protein
MAQEKNGTGETDGFGTKDSGGESDFGALSGGTSDSGLGNLPPLSDFESSAGAGFDSGLPPLSSIDPSSDKERISVGGLPPISDIPVETPIPTGGAIKPTPAGYGSTPVFGTPSSDSGVDTPSGSGFQDLSADSDFTPETPEVAPPGPESDIDTPLFDSAFGGGAASFTAADTSAPTQAMPAPMFGADNGGFDPDAFAPAARGGAPAFEGTPVPDFGPDTAAPTAVTPPPSMAPVMPAAPAARGGAGRTILTAAIMLIVGMLVGTFGLIRVPGVPNPLQSELDAKIAENQQLQSRVTKLTQTQTPGGEQLSVEQVDKLIEQRNALNTEITGLTTQRDAVQTDIASAQNELATVTDELDRKNAEYAEVQSAVEQSQNELAIAQARADGLASETARLENLVGRLEDANQRREMTKDTLASNVDALEILVREGSPLAPEKYARDVRVARVEALKERVAAANWVDPALLDEYTSLYQQELDIARAREYFYARIPVADRFGTNTMSWAECVMNGNWSVYYRTLDGQHVGVYQNVATAGPPRYGFIDAPDEMAAKQIEAEIFASRTPGFEEKLEQLAQKQIERDERTPLQRNFESL